MNRAAFICALLLATACSRVVAPPSVGKIMTMPRAEQISEMRVTMVDTIDRPALSGKRFSIPRENIGAILLYMIPKDEYTDSDRLSRVNPIVCIVNIKTSSGATDYFIRSMGDRPLIMSVDGELYFSAERPEKVSDPALVLVEYVATVGKEIKADK